MQNANCFISPVRRTRLENQGFTGYSDTELAARTFGFRFATGLCTLFIGAGVAFANVPLLSIIAATALLGALLPNHPFDYLYNITFRHWLGKGKLAPNPPQRKFACAIAAIWLAGLIVLFHFGFYMWGYVLGAVLASVALLVTVTDFCIPSLMYNYLFK